MNAETKTEAAADAASSDVFEALINKAVQRIERAATPQVQPMELRSFDELERWAERAARSNMVPKDYKGKPDDIILAVQFGAEVGLRPLQALWNIATINGKPSIYGDAMLALCKTHPAYVSIEETLNGIGDKMEARCVVIRRGEPPFISTFSVEDAKTAKLWNKKGYNGQDTPWITNPKRMLQFRARGFALRDAFPDKLRGLISAEEASDYPVQSAAPPRPEPEPEVHYPPPPTTEKTPQQKFTEWLAKFKAEADACDTQAEFEQMCGREEITRVTSRLKNGMKDEFDHVVGLTLDRLTGMDIVSQQMET